MLTTEECEQLRAQAELQGMPACEKCKVIPGTLTDDIITVREVPAVPMSQADRDVQVARAKHEWTVVVQDVTYAVGQDSRYLLIAYAPWPGTT